MKSIISYKIIPVSFMLISLLFPISADPISVTVGINNVPPQLSSISVEGDKDISISFTVTEHNSFYDIKEIKIKILIDNKETTLSWNPTLTSYETSGILKIGEGALPSGEMSKLGTFDFSLALHFMKYSHIVVSVEVSDKGGHFVSGQITKEGMM